MAKKRKPEPAPGNGPRSGVCILAIDPGLSTGWAYTRGRFGVERFQRRPWRHPQAHYLDFRAWLLERVAELGVTALAYEAALGYAVRNGNTTRIEWQGIINAVAAECDLPVVSVLPSALKKYATGNGTADKAAMLAALRERFPRIQVADDQHDVIDAIWVLSWATAEMHEGRICKDWTGFPQNAIGRGAICNRCQFRFRSGVECPRCGSIHSRLEA